MLHQGRVKRWHEDRGFGFITPKDGGEEVFVHANDLRCRNFRCLTVGEEVEYEVVTEDRGRSRASNVTAPGGNPLPGALSMPVVDSSMRPYGELGARGGCYRCGKPGHISRDCTDGRFYKNNSRGGVEERPPPSSRYGDRDRDRDRDGGGGRESARGGGRDRDDRDGGRDRDDRRSRDDHDDRDRRRERFAPY